MRMRMQIILAGLLGGLVLASGCADRQTRRDVYVHMMTPLERSRYEYLEASRKPLSLRLAYLQEIGVYQRWAEVPKNLQDAILRCEVVEGMTSAHVRMAWGEPDRVRDESFPAERAAGKKRIVWDYDLTSRSGSGGYRRSVCLLDDEVLWVREAE